MKKAFFCAFFAGMAVLTASALSIAHSPAAGEVAPTFVTVGLVKGLTLENAMSSDLWSKVPQYDLMFRATELSHINRKPLEGASVRYLCTDTTFFVRADLTDSDVMTIANKNQDFHYIRGDVLEVFVKPKKDHYYWEIYGTPNKHYSNFYYSSKATCGLPSGYAPTDVKIDVDTKVHGTFNKYDDRDKGWTVIIAIPRQELEKNGREFAPGSDWTILVGRYNYSVHLPEQELSSYPQIPRSYHATDYYANIKFVNINMEEN